MKRIVFLLLVGLAIVMNLYAQDEYQYIKIANENLRDGPNGNRIASILGGSKVKVIEKDANWVKVQLTAWVWAKSLTDDPMTVEGFKVRGSHILVATEAEAREVLNQLKSGSKFEDVAKAKSIDRLSGVKGGDLGRFGKGDLLPEFENVIFRLDVGELSGIVKSSAGYHIMKRTE
jgi:uncharacterized protein YgiM (DUF1202 family)